MKTATIEDYIVYQALKNGVSIKGSESPNQQFASIARAAGAYEAAKLVLGSTEIDPLITALREYTLEEEVRQDVQRCVAHNIIAQEILARDETTKTTPVFQIANFYAPEFPTIASEVGRYFLHDNPSYDFQGYHLQDSKVSAGIHLLLQSGMEQKDVAQIVLNPVQNGRGAMYKIKDYLFGIDKNAKSAREKRMDSICGIKMDPEIMARHFGVYNLIDTVILDILTPQLLLGALAELKFTEEESQKLKPDVDSRAYTNIKKRRRELDDGTKEEQERGHIRFYQQGWNWSKEKLIEKIRNICHDNSSKERETDLYLDWDLQNLRREISPLVKLLDAFESYLSPPEFESRGYLGVKAQVQSFTDEVEGDACYIRKGLTDLSDKLLVDYGYVKNKNENAKQPWYTSLTGWFRRIQL